MYAHTIYDCASLGIIRYSDGTARPPARFRKKLSAWESRNGTGRLVKKEPPRSGATYSSPACFTLHEGDFGEGSIIVVSVRAWSVERPALRDRRASVDRHGACPAGPGRQPRTPASRQRSRGRRTLARQQCVQPCLSGGDLCRRGRRGRHRGPGSRLTSSPHKPTDDRPGDRASDRGPVPFYGDRHVRLEQKLLPRRAAEETFS